MTMMDEDTNNWIQKTWRPAIGVTYIIINIFDFIIFPILWTVSGFFNGNHTQWTPLTLESTGMFHMAFGAILGVAAWNRNNWKGRFETPEDDRYSQYSRYTHRNDDYRRPTGPRISPRYKETSIDNQEPSSVYRGENNE